MEKGVRNNLSILAEEDSEEENTEESDNENSEEDTDSENEDGNNRGVKIGEQNKFDNLCDGVVNAMALVHDTLQELLEMKDEMLKHSLPPTLLMQMAMISGRMFRSISDLGMPIGELIRLVHVYSTPWEEKSAALKKLHEDYESKQRQLNIAIKRLQLVDAHSKRIAREKRIMNWEKLFSKMTSSKGHGRRWKFLIETIKEKAKLGLEHVQAYTQSLAESSESEAEEKPTDQIPEEGEVSSQMFHQEAINQSDINEDEEEEKNEEKESSDEDMAGDTEGNESLVSGGTGDTEVNETRSPAWISTSPKRVRFENMSVSEPVHPPMKDVDVWTGEPDYDRSLFIRTFCPEGLRQTELKCSLSYGGKMFKTTLLDPLDDDLKIRSPDMLDDPPSKRPQAARKGEDRSSLEVPGSSALNHGSAKNYKNKRYFEFEIKVPDEVKEGVLSTSLQTGQEPDNLQFAVHKGKYEEIIAMATLDFQEIKKMTLETVYLPPPHGDDNVAGIKSRADSFSDESSLNAESLSDSVDIPILMDESGDRVASTTSREDLVKASEPIPISLYSLHTGKSDAVQTPSGTLPLIIYWGKRARPLHFNRQCGTLGVNDLVFELTGIDLDITTKEDLHKDMVDKALSAVAFTPEAEEVDTVPRSEFDQMVERHQEEMVYIQDEYEKRIQELLNNLQDIQSENAQLSQLTIQHQRPVSSASHRPLSTASQRGLLSNVSTERHMEPPPSGVDLKPATPQSARNIMRDKTLSDVGDGRRAFVSESMPEVKRPLPPKNMKPYKNFRIGRPLPKWGESLPQDFFERLKLWEDESKQHKDELNEKTLKDIKDSLEKKLAGQHKLSKDEEKIYDALKGATEVRLTQPPSVFQLPPLPNSKFPVVNLFELSKNFHNQGPTWLVERYIQQQHPLSDDGCHTTRQTSLLPETTTDQTPFTEIMDSSSSVGAQVKSEIES